MISSIANLVHELPHELPNDVRLRIWGNKEILGKSQIWVETQPSAQSPFQKLNFGSNSQKTRKSGYRTFLVLSSFTEFLYFVSNILPRIVWANKALVLTRPSLLQTLSSLHFVYYQNVSPTFKENIKQISSATLPNLMVLCKQDFCVFSLGQKLTLKSFHRYLLVVYWQN